MSTCYVYTTVTCSLSALLSAPLSNSATLAIATCSLSALLAAPLSNSATLAIVGYI